MSALASHTARIVAMLLLVTVWSGGALAEDLPRAQDLTRQAGARLVQDDAPGALALLEDAYEALPRSRVAARNLALAFSRVAEADLRAERLESALTRFERALELHPGRLRYELGLARTRFLLGDELAAMQDVEALAERAPGYAAVHMLTADIHERRGDLEAALAALSRAAPLVLEAERAPLARRAVRLSKQAKTEAQFRTDSSGHFLIRYAADVDAATVALVRELLEDAYVHVTAELGLTPRSAARIVLYADGEFRDVTGAQAWVGALYEGGVLRVPARNLERHRDSAARILTHEFTHHILRERTPHLPAWWHEGIAQWQEFLAAGGGKPRVDLARARDAEALLSLAQMRALRPFNQQGDVVTLFYAQSRSFVLWLVDRSGRTGISDFLTNLGTGTDTDAAAKRALGASVQALWSEWLRDL
jgi:tetratricopeptide (TPR) repeat protein